MLFVLLIFCSESSLRADRDDTSVDDVVLALLGRLLSVDQLESFRIAIEKMKGDDNATSIFDRDAYDETLADFQLGPCV